MTQTLARIKQAGKNFEILVNLDDALKFKKGESDFIEAEGDKIFTDSKKARLRLVLICKVRLPQKMLRKLLKR